MNSISESKAGSSKMKCSSSELPAFFILPMLIILVLVTGIIKYKKKGGKHFE